MARFRPLALSALILGLVALAALGVRQVIVEQEGDQPETDRQVAPPGEGQLGAGAETQREMIRQFIEEGGDVCSLPVGDGPHGLAPHPDLPTLINDIQLIVTGEPASRVVEQPVGLASRVLTVVEIDEVLSGETPGPTVKVESSERLTAPGPGRLGRLTVSDFDGCASGRVLLFLNPTERPGEFLLNRQGWARIEGGTVEVAPRNELLQDYAGAEELLAAVRQIAQEQADLPKGLLLCQFKRTSPDFIDPDVCPGE